MCEPEQAVRQQSSGVDRTYLEAAKRDPEFVRWQTSLQNSVRKAGLHVNLSGPGPAHKAYLLAALFAQKPDAPFLLIVPDVLQLRLWKETLSCYFPKLRTLLPREWDLHRTEATSRKEEHERLAVLLDLAQGESMQLLVAAPAVLQRLPSVLDFQKLSLTIHPDHAPGPETLEHRLLDAGYEKRPTAEAAGQFARRGDILDVVPISWNTEHFGQGGGEGLRLTYFDEDLDGMTRYSLETQRSLAPCREAVHLGPAREVLLSSDPQIRGDQADRILEEGRKTVASMRKRAQDSTLVHRMEDLFAQTANALREGLGHVAWDPWVDLLWEEETSVLEYWQATDSGRLVFVDEPGRCLRAWDARQAEWTQRVSDALLKGQVPECALQAQLPRTEWMRRLDRQCSVASLATIGTSDSGFPGAQAFVIRGREGESHRGKELEFAKQLQTGTQAPPWICVPDPEKQEKLETLLREQQVDPTRYHLTDLPLAHGFEYPAADLRFIGVEELFFRSSTKRRRRHKKALSIDLFSDLRPGDLVVHDVHGIGCYEGLETVEQNGVRRDYLRLRYAKDDTLFLPMDALDRIQKYIGGSEGSAPKLSRLGGGEWNKLKARARESIRTLATDLVALYAKRRRSKGYAFGSETSWEQEFAMNFPYEETEDQLQAISEIVQDMETPCAMDRLLCGDVGFGKTEVAFRAIFKCVMGGKQAAFVAPTTVLAQQHYDNFRKRVGEFPVRVGLLSRFTLPAEQRRILRALRTGGLDVVIGTHRMLSKDVAFQDLGLLVVDEEQRFGVDQKESIKAKHPDVDVLSLSATPIPRTLHMSLSGIRPISVLEEPPMDRRSVLTYVMEYDSAVLQEAILRELGRGGQVFYLYNDTYHMADKVAQLQELLPGARIVWAHGKMGEHQLEQVIAAFVAGEADVLVCTTIIESGIDMPNVNTLIVERADRLGLAQLYQLRGRVGRSGRQAYAYITYRRDQVLNEQAEQRLAAIRDYTELGAGFKIAMRDLEVRGAGNLLGGEQHGQMEAIGYDLYCRMLDEEIQSLRALEDEGAEEASSLAQGDLANASQSRQDSRLPDAWFQPVDCLVELPLDAYLTRSFVPDEGQRMDLYRRLTAIDHADFHRDVLDELMDRFGTLPDPVWVLAEISYVRHRARRVGIQSIALDGSGKRVLMKLAPDIALPMQRLGCLLACETYKGQLVFAAESKPYLLFIPRSVQPREILEELGNLFRKAEELEQAETSGIRE